MRRLWRRLLDFLLGRRRLAAHREYRMRVTKILLDGERGVIVEMRVEERR